MSTTTPTTHGMLDDEGDVIGECGMCREQRELVATVRQTVKKDGVPLGACIELDVCGECASRTIHEMAPLADSIEVELGDAGAPA